MLNLYPRIVGGLRFFEEINMKFTSGHKSFSLTFILGMSIWVLSPIIFNIREPWDASPFTYLITLLLAGFLSTTFWGRQLRSSYFGIWMGQFLGLTIVTFLQPSSSEARAWWGIIPVVTTGLASILIFGGIVLVLIVKFLVHRIK